MESIKKEIESSFEFIGHGIDQKGKEYSFRNYSILMQLSSTQVDELKKEFKYFNFNSLGFNGYYNIGFYKSMKKEYFEQHIPKDGGFRRSVKDANGIPIDYEYEVVKMICSKNIEIGDEYYHNGWPAKERWTGKPIEGDVFKVIGYIPKILK